jgi:WXG100 family type VII secretion target
MSDKTELNYEQMQGIVKKLQGEAEAINQLLSQTKSGVENLHGNGWVGRGSEQFFQEMESLVLPAMGRLVGALHAAANAADQVVNIYRQAEDEAQGMFKSFNE